MRNRILARKGNIGQIQVAAGLDIIIVDAVGLVGF